MTGGLAAAAALAPGAATAARASAACTPASNVEAIIDDSGSMAGTDSNKLRSSGLQLFIANPDNAKKTLGAVAFGSQATTVFAPALVSSAKAQMVAALNAAINADDGLTEYDLAFQKAAADNPSSQVRIFLTDGGATSEYMNGHRLPGAGGVAPRTYVVGLGIGKATPPVGGQETNGGRLQRIAAETGGRYFPDVTAPTLQGTFNTISALVNCQPVPRLVRFRTFTRSGQSQAKSIGLSKSAKRVSLVINWANPSNAFKIVSIQALGSKGKTLATFSRRLKVKRFSSKTFAAYTITKPRGTKRLRFRLKARRVVISESPQAQVNQLRR